MGSLTRAEHEAAIASLRLGDIIRRSPGSLTVTGIVEDIVGPIEYRDFPRMQVQVRWADNGKPRRGDAPGSLAGFDDFFMRDKTLCTPGMYGPDDIDTWERVEQAIGVQLELFGMEAEA